MPSNIWTTVSELTRIDHEITSLVKKFARSNNEMVRGWLCEMLADLVDRREKITEDHIK